MIFFRNQEEGYFVFCSFRGYFVFCSSRCLMLRIGFDKSHIKRFRGTSLLSSSKSWLLFWVPYPRSATGAPTGVGRLPESGVSPLVPCLYICFLPLRLQEKLFINGMGCRAGGGGERDAPTRRPSWDLRRFQRVQESVWSPDGNGGSLRPPVSLVSPLRR